MNQSTENDRPVLLTPWIICSELLRLAELIQPGDLSAIYVHGESDGLFWCNGKVVKGIKIPASDLFLPLDDFQRKHLNAVIDAWAVASPGHPDPRIDSERASKCWVWRSSKPHPTPMPLER